MFNVGLCAGVAQLVEHKLPKLGVASSNLVARSRVRRLDCTFFLQVIPFVSSADMSGFESGLAHFFLCQFQGVAETQVYA